jgi:3',5'-cyclic AMP phosphodiesterase CpdA
VKSFIHSLERTGFTVLIAPGNHDYGTGSWGFGVFIKIFKKIYYKNPSFSFPKLDIIDNNAYIALDSMAGVLKGHITFFAQGKIGKSQLDDLRKLLYSPAVIGCNYIIIYLHHHPMDYRPFMQLLDSEELGEIIVKKVDILLFGHFHEKEANGEVKNFHGIWDIQRCYNAGSSTGKDNKQGKIMIIDPVEERLYDQVIKLD